ncbi:PEP/pyruvate-binding domain-containing protein [Desulfobacca acetoxidans]
MNIFRWFKGKGKSAPSSGMEAFKKKYESFKNLLDANNDALELMARLESVAEGDFVFDIQFIRSRSSSILAKVGIIVEELNVLGDNRYEAIKGIYEDLQTKISSEVSTVLPDEIIPLALPLTQIDRRHLSQVGAKNANLGEMKNRLGLPTPDGFALTHAAYHSVVAENDLTDRIRHLLYTIDPNNLEELTAEGESLKTAFREAVIPTRLREEVTQHYQQLVALLGYAPPLALRSSGIYEDQEFSFAGLFLTRLNVSFQDFFPAYLEVLASQFNPRALVYLCQKRLTHREQAMSVGCLAMVPAAAAGVMFTVDPLSGASDVILIDATWGLGPAVVDGAVTPDRFFLAKKPTLTLIDQHIHDKPILLAGLEGAAGLTTMAVSGDQRTKPALTEEQLLTIGRYGLQLEDHFGEPQDIEFAIDPPGTIVLMQTRPLQVLASQPEEASPAFEQERHPVLIDNGTVACFGVVSGPAFVIGEDQELSEFPEGAILVARHTSVRYGMILHKARGMVIDIGSATSHLAILAREFKIPTLVDAGQATTTLRSGQIITLDATHLRVYEGEIPELLAETAKKTATVSETAIYAKLRRVLRWITPLNLVDPKLSDLTPAACKTLHDITRFAHQMGISEMFKLAEQASQYDIQSVRLKTPIPLNLHIIDLGGGLETGRHARFIPPESITSIPMQAVWRGISHPEISWAGPIPIDVKGLYSVVSRSLTAAPAEHADFWSRTFAIVSRNYVNFSSRLGYHFATIDAYVSDTRNDNYITFRFKGGAADEVRRGRRVRFLGAVLKKLDFEVEVTGDLVVGRLWKYPRELLEEKLDLLGRLMGCARQRDMLMADDAMVDRYAEAFLAGRYRFEGEAGSVPSEKIQERHSS